MKKVISIILIIIMILPLFSCSKKDNYISNVLEGVFDSVATISAYNVDAEEFNKNCDEAFSLLQYYHKLFDIYNEYSGMNNICTINKNPEVEIEVSSDLIEFLDYAKTMYYVTNGEMNIAFGSVLSIWHNYREEGIEDPENATLPSISELEEAEKHTNIEKIIINRENSSVMLADKNMSIDVGAVAKGYATEMCAEMLERKGILNRYLLSVGGNIRAIGKKNDDENFSIGIENPNGNDYLKIISIEELSVVTSGDYQRYYEVDGQRYHHIIDEDTLFPKNEFRLVSVVCKDSAFADALSTAIFNMSFEDGREYVELLEGVEVLWLFPDGKIEYSSGFEKMIKK